MNADPASKEDVLGILLDACRMIKDYEQALHWAAQLSDLYRSQGEETEALRTDAEMGSFMVRIGQQEAGLSLIDHVAAQLTAAGNMKFNELDAMIVVLKRKAELCNEIGLYDDVIPATQRMLDLLDDYEKRPEHKHSRSADPSVCRLCGNSMAQNATEQPLFGPTDYRVGGIQGEV